MPGAAKQAFVWYLVCLCIQGVSADGSVAGIIVAGVVAAVILILLVIGITIYCLNVRKGTINRNDHKEKRKENDGYYNGTYHVHNGIKQHHHPQQHYNHTNDYLNNAPSYPSPSLPFQFIERPPLQYTSRYQTYHGTPSDVLQQPTTHERPETLSGPPPIVIPFGTITLRTDPRPVIHKSNRKRNSSETQHRSPSKQQSHLNSQEFVIEQTYDGIPVIRPVIYVDDDKHKRGEHRSKSSDRRYKKMKDRSSSDHHFSYVPTSSKVSMDDRDVHSTTKLSRSQTPSSSHVQKPAERTRTRSKMDPINAVPQQDNIGYVSDNSSQSNAPSFGWALNEPAPEPKAGDIMFFPAGTNVTNVHERNQETHAEPKDEVYTYAKIIKSSVSTLQSREERPVATTGTPVMPNGNEMPISLRKSKAGTHEYDTNYQTEQEELTDTLNNNGTSMSDRLQQLVEKGDTERSTHYNVETIDFDQNDQDHHVQNGVMRPKSPRNDIPDDDFRSDMFEHRKTPPIDIPVSPRESTIVLPLNLQSPVISSGEKTFNYMPNTPDNDFAINSKSAFDSTRPPTPPIDFPVTPKTSFNEHQLHHIKLPSFDEPAINASVIRQSVSSQPVTFQAKQRLVEAHLLKNVNSAPASSLNHAQKSNTVSNSSHPQSPKAVTTVPLVKITPGVVPQAPPPPLLK